jgi:hypothetical protein
MEKGEKESVLEGMSDEQYKQYEQYLVDLKQVAIAKN